MGDETFQTERQCEQRCEVRQCLTGSGSSYTECDGTQGLIRREGCRVGHNQVLKDVLLFLKRVWT